MTKTLDPTEIPLIVPGSEPFFIPRGPVGCLLMHGFTSMPEEVHPFGEDLANHGYTVLGIRLPGHATHPSDMNRVKPSDWLVAVEEGLALLSECTRQVIAIGQSFGGNLALLAASRYSIAGAVAIATPYPMRIPPIQRTILKAFQVLQPTTHKGGTHPHPELGIRREAEYPAYMEYPRKVIWELIKIQEMMAAGLPQVNIPVLLIHSKDDPMVPAAGAQYIYDELGTEDKQFLLIDGFGHGVLSGSRRDEVVKPVAEFIRRTAC